MGLYWGENRVITCETKAFVEYSKFIRNSTNICLDKFENWLERIVMKSSNQNLNIVIGCLKRCYLIIKFSNFV